MLDHVPGLLTSTIPAIVMPRKTSSETSRPAGFAAKSLGDIEGEITQEFFSTQRRKEPQRRKETRKGTLHGARQALRLCGPLRLCVKLRVKVSARTCH